MVTVHRKALELLWKDRCTVIQKVEVTDPDTKLTGFDEAVTLENQPCKLSFESLAATGEGHTAAKIQAVKLFLAPDVDIPAGSKIMVTRFGEPDHKFIFSHSGEAGIFSNHQEIELTLWEGWA